jgi:hypothetical protein
MCLYALVAYILGLWDLQVVQVCFGFFWFALDVAMPLRPAPRQPEPCTLHATAKRVAIVVNTRALYLGRSNQAVRIKKKTNIQNHDSLD